MTDIISAVLYGSLAALGIMFWRRRRTGASAWLALTFAALGFITIQSLIVPQADPGATAPAALSVEAIYRDLLIILLLATPWLLLRFARSLAGAPRTWGDGAADAVLGLLALATLVLPPIPAEGAPHPPWFTAYYAVVLAWWSAALLSVTYLLWRAGRDQPGVVRNRMRLLGVAGLSLQLALLVRPLLGDDSPLAQMVTSGLAWGGAVGFWLGVEPPSVLRRSWRASDEARFRDAEGQLVRAETAEAAGQAVVEAAARLVGGIGARIEDAAGRLLASVGEVDDGEALHVRGQASAVTVSQSTFTPVLGQDEEVLLRQLCSHLDLVLQRIAAFEAGEQARRVTEQVNVDLQQLVYGIGHDLRNPLVTILGFLEVLKADSGELGDQGRLAVDRITRSARYMDDLIQDLLKLSRVGRTDSDPSPVALGPLAEEIAADVVAHHDGVAVEVQTDAEVMMNPIRARQLLTNLIENAARHGDHRPLTVTVGSQPVGGGMVQIDVADDGIGIDPEDRDRVFQIFQRLGGFDVSSPGSGIGLTMCRRIVEEAGGSITVADPPPGHTGTVLRLQLPSPRPIGTASRLESTGAPT